MGKSQRSREQPVEPASLQVAVPEALRREGAYAMWREGGPGRLLGQLARDYATGEATLTPLQLAKLVELFQDEPLPDSLRMAVVGHLRGRRVRKQGARPKRLSAVEQVEQAMLPDAYAEALQEAEVERARLRSEGKKRARHGDPDKLPTATSLACALVRARLPSFASLSDRSLMNLVSRSRGELVEGADERPPASRRKTRSGSI